MTATPQAVQANDGRFAYKSEVQPVWNNGARTDVICNITVTTALANWNSHDDTDNTGFIPFPNDIDVSLYREFLIMFVGGTFVGGTTPSIQVFAEHVFPGGQLFDMIDGGAMATPTNVFHSVGPGTGAGLSIGNLVRIVAAVTGAPTSATFSVVIIAKN